MFIMPGASKNNYRVAGVKSLLGFLPILKLQKYINGKNLQ